MSIQKELDFIRENSNLFLDYLRERYPVHANSNIFLRDIQYGVKSFFDKKDIKLKQKEIDIITKEIIRVFENTGILFKLSDNTWKVNYLSKNNVAINNSSVKN